MNLFDKLVVLYLKPLWWLYCVGVFVEDKLFGTNIRNESFFKHSPGPWLFPEVLLMMSYAFIVPMWLIFMFADGTRAFHFSVMYALVVIGVLVYAIKRRKNNYIFISQAKVS